MKKNLLSGLVLLLLVVQLASCTLDEPGTPATAFPIQLNVDQDFSLVNLSWNPVNVTGFKEYILLQSTSEIQPNPTPQTTSETSIIKRIDDASVTEFFTSDILFADKVCYKLYVAIDDRFLQSGNVCVQHDFKLLDGFYDRATHEEGSQEVVMFDRVNRRLSVYNLATGEITSTIPEDLLQFPVMDVSTWGNSRHLFAYDQSPGRYKKYTLPSFSSPNEKFFGTVLFAAKSFRQFIFASVETFGATFKVLNRSNLNEIDSENGFLGNRNIAVFEGDPLTVLEVGETSINKYHIDGNGAITFVSSSSPGAPQLQTQNFTAQGENLFIAGRSGQIINRDGNIVGKLISNINSVIIISRLSADEKRVAYIITDNNEIRFEVADISDPSAIDVLTSYNLPSANYSDVVIEENLIHVVGVTFASGQAQTFILKYPMPL